MKRMGLFVTAVVALTLCLAASAFAYGVYDSLNWVAAKGTALYSVNDRETAMISFSYYQEIFTDVSTKYSGHFLCKHNGIETQIPVADIRSIALAIKPKEFSRRIYPDKLKKLVLTMKNGRTFNVEVARDMGFALSNYENIEFRYFNAVNNRFEYGGVLGENLREIRFE